MSILNLENKLSKYNSTSTILLASETFLGLSDLVIFYNTIIITIISDVISDTLGVQLEFSQDNINWDIVIKKTHINISTYSVIKQDILAKYFRIRYKNSDTNQTYFRLQTKYILFDNDNKNVILNESHIDIYNRIRISNPITLFSITHVLGSNLGCIHELIDGSASSIYNIDESQVILSTTGTGSIIRRTRRRSIYQPGKSLLIYISGCLNSGSNDSTVTTKIGHYDNENGYYFQYNNGILSIVARSKITGSLIENIINQSDWNNNYNSIIDVTKNLIFWFELDWLNCVKLGVIINNKTILLHSFYYSNVLTTPYIKIASLPITFEMISTGGNGSLNETCMSAICEGGVLPIGRIFSVNTGITEKSINNIANSIIALKFLSNDNNDKITAIIKDITILTTSNANTLVELYKFFDMPDTMILTNPSWVSVLDGGSALQYDISSTAIDLTYGIKIDSTYFSSKSNSTNLDINGDNNFITTNPVGISDLFCLVVQKVGGGGFEDYSASITWKEFI